LQYCQVRKVAESVMWRTKNAESAQLLNGLWSLHAVFHWLKVVFGAYTECLGPRLAMTNEQTDIVLFFSDGEISQQMLLPEFDALLDQVISLPEYADTEMKLAYVKVNRALKVTAAVLFLLKFDHHGAADKRWNLALDHLAQHTPYGPDLGAGPIRLSCRSQCSVAWHQQQLWDPNLELADNTLKRIAEAVSRNTLGLKFESVPQAKEPENKRSALADQIKQQRLQIAALKNRDRERARQWQRDAQHRIKALESKLKEAQGEKKQAEKNAQRFQALLRQQEKRLHEDRAQYSNALRKTREVDADELAALEQRLEREYEAARVNAVNELETQLAVKSMELAYSEELNSSLEQQLQQQQERLEKILNQNAASYLAQLEESGVRFVAFHEGAGHISLSRLDVGRYLDSPTAFAAAYCGVDKQLYRQWLAHYKMPQCSARLASGELCCEPVPRLESPEQFVAMYSDRCQKHQNYRGSLRRA
jgi:hypothetical protein